MQLSQQMSLFDADPGYVVEFVHKAVAASLRMLFIHRGQFVLCGFEHGLAPSPGWFSPGFWEQIDFHIAEGCGLRGALPSLRRSGPGFDGLRK